MRQRQGAAGENQIPVTRCRDDGLGNVKHEQPNGRFDLLIRLHETNDADRNEGPSGGGQDLALGEIPATRRCPLPSHLSSVPGFPKVPGNLRGPLLLGGLRVE